MVLSRHIGWKRTFCITLCLSVTCPGYHTSTRGCVPASQQPLPPSSSFPGASPPARRWSPAARPPSPGRRPAAISCPAAPLPSPRPCSPSPPGARHLNKPRLGTRRTALSHRNSLPCARLACAQLGIWWGKHQLRAGDRGTCVPISTLSHWVFSSTVSSPSFRLLSHKTAIQTDF